MSRHARAYRALVRLYPSSFRRRYRDDLVQVFADLVERDGPVRAWTRTSIDLCCTVPRYQLEVMMNPAKTTFVLQLSVAGLAIFGVVGILIDVYPGAALLMVALVLGITQRSRLASSTRVPDPNRRRRLLRTAAILAVACVLGTGAMFWELAGSEDWHGGKLVLYNLYFFITAFGALGSFVAGVCTPRGPAGSGRPVAA